MKLDLNLSKKTIDFIKYVIEHKQPHQKDLDLISLISCATHTPIILCLIYYAHLYGTDIEIENKISFLKTFYGITDIIGLENYPYNKL